MPVRGLSDVLARQGPWVPQFPVRVMLGIINAVNPDGYTATVSVRGTIVGDIPFISSVYPVPGAQVVMVTGNTGLTIIGSTDRRTAVSGPNSVLGVAPPTPPTPATPSTLTLSPVTVASYATIGSLWTTGVLQAGEDIGYLAGIWYDPTAFAVLAGTGIVSATISTSRIGDSLTSNPNPLYLAPVLWQSPDNGPVATPPNTAGTAFLGSAGQTYVATTAAVPHEVIDAMVNGEAFGFVMSTGRWNGLDTPIFLDPGSGTLTITYL